MAGLLLAIVGLALQTAKRSEHPLIMSGLEIAVAGLAFGVGLLLIFVLLRGGFTSVGFTSVGGRDLPASRPREAPLLERTRQPAGAQRPAALAGVTGQRIPAGGDRGAGAQPHRPSPSGTSAPP